MSTNSEYYHEQAILAEAEAKTATLDHIRERAEGAAATWNVLAAQERSFEQSRERRALAQQFLESEQRRAMDG